MIEAKFSTKYQAVKARIRRLPKLVEGSADTFTKKDAVALIDTFRDGIENDSFGLARLQPTTIARKIKQGKKKPRNPLLGEGENRDTSYINLFKVRKIKNGYRVYPRWAKHYGSGLDLRHLFAIHERGALIRRPNGTITRIPPRPAFAKAFRKHLNERQRAENVRQVRDAMAELIKNGSEYKFKKLNTKTKETDKHDET